MRVLYMQNHRCVSAVYWEQTFLRGAASHDQYKPRKHVWTTYERDKALVCHVLSTGGHVNSV